MPLPLSIELATFARLILGGVILLYLWPRYAFGTVPEVAKGDAAVGYAARMIVLLIAAGYALAATHLFSWITLALAVALLGLLRSQPARSGYELDGRMRFAARLLTELDRLGSWPERLQARLRARPQAARSSQSRRVSAYAIAGALVLLAVLGVATWMRLASPLQHASIPFSDSDVVIYWVQAVEQQVLFPNGIYPEGFHIFMADLIRLTVANPIVTVKFFGPIAGIAMVASVGFTAYRLSGRVAAAVVAVLLYGTLPHLLPYEYLRQVGTDSQEFGNAFVLPTLWFVYASWVYPSRWYRGTALALLTIAGLTHPVVALNAALAAVAGSVAAWLANGVRWEALGWYLRWTPVAVLVAIVPLAVALGLGIHLNSSGASFATAVSHTKAPPITIESELAVAGAVLLLLVRAVRLIARRTDRRELGMPVAALLTVLAALAIREAPLFGIHSVVLASRAGEFVALADAVAIGLGLSALQELLELLHVATGRWLALVGATALTAFAWIHYRPVPIDAFASSRWLPDDFVVAYVDIGSSQEHGSWLAVSDDSGFDYTYGQSFFMRGEDFLAHTTTSANWPRYVYGGGSSAPLGESRIFIFADKRTVVAPQYDYVVVPRRRKAQAAIHSWLKTWQASHGPLPVYFKGPDVTVYELARPGTAQTLGDTAP